MGRRAKGSGEYPIEVQALAGKLLRTEGDFEVKLGEPKAKAFRLQIYNYRNAVYKELKNKPELYRLDELLGKAEFRLVDDWTVRVVQPKPLSDADLEGFGLSREDFDEFCNLGEPASPGGMVSVHLEGVDAQVFEEEDEPY